MKNVRLILEYDGTDYHGFQRQPNGLTVQEALENAVSRITGSSVIIAAAGRTDSGVHATGQVCSFHTDTNISAEGLINGINSLLPADISVRSLDFADSDFHARFSAKSRHYSYRILNRKAPSALLSRYTWHVKKHLDLDAMRKAAEFLLGTHDFASFANTPCVPDTVRDVKALSIHRAGDIVYIDIKANGFLRSMVRNITGHLAEIGLGKGDPEDTVRLLQAADRCAAGRCAPAQGLFFTHVDY